MHIVAMENEPSSRLGGQELNLLEICQSMAKRGHLVSLVFVRQGDLLEQYEKICHQVVQVKSYGTAKTKLSSILEFSANSIGDGRKIRTHSDSVIFCNDLSSVLFGCYLSKIKRIPLVHYLQLPGTKFNLKPRLGLSGVSKFIAVSQYTKNSWVQNAGIASSKTSVVFNGVDASKYFPFDDSGMARKELSIPANSTVLLFAGRLNPNKGVDVLIKAFGEFFGKFPEAILLIAGNVVLEPGFDTPEGRSAYLDYLKQLASDTGALNNIRFLGHCSDIPLLFKAADITVVPSTWPDPCPRIVLESLSAGTPVIGSRVGGIPEQLGTQFEDWLVEPKDHQQLYRKLVSLKEQISLDPGLGKTCREYVARQFSPTKMMDGIESELSGLVSPSKMSKPSGVAI
jgi:glycosyltransferase involved in cell wall biosynthesis